MINILWPILQDLRIAFSNQITFMWFCSAVIGLCAGGDAIGGITNITRNLVMTNHGYWGLCRFFGSSAVNFHSLKEAWIRLVIHKLFESNTLRVAGKLLVLIDATKVPKQGRRMPGIIGMKDTINDCWMRGHYFEQLCLVVRGVHQFFPVPIAISMLLGVIKSESDKKNTVDRCRDFIAGFPLLEGCIVVGDSWYSKSKLIIGLAKKRSITMITRLAHNAVAYEAFVANPFAAPRRGRKKKYGDKIILGELFKGDLETWTLTDNSGDDFTVEGWCRDLLWKPLGMMVRFVGVSHPEKGKWILLCSNTKISPQEIAGAYVYRFWIEVGFHVAKSLIGAFTYRFWSKALEKLGSFPKELELFELNGELKKKIEDKVKSIEIFTFCSMVAQAMLVYLSINYAEKIADGAKFWMRTKRGDLACERMTAAYMEIELRNLSQADLSPHALQKFIQKKQGKIEIGGENLEKATG